MRLFFLFFLFFYCNLFSQSTITISGKVKSDENIGLVGANVGFNENYQNRNIVTDSLGAFVATVGLRSVSISINHFGYKEKNIIFSLRKDTVLSIILEKDTSVLREVTVFNAKKSAITSLSGGKLSFNLKELSSLATILGTTDLIKILQLTPGVQNSGDANGYLYVRGGDSSHNSILYGGIPIYGMSHLLGIFPFYNTDHIQDVEFDKSSSNAKYGGRLSSTTLLIPNKKLPAELTIQGSIGLLASQITMAVPLSKKSGLFMSGRKTYIDEIVVPILNSFTKNSDAQNIKYGFSDYNLTYITDISKKNSFFVDGFVSVDNFKIEDSNIALRTSLKWSNFSFSPTLISKLSPRTSMSNAVYFTQYTNNLEMQQSTVQMKVSSFVQDFGFTNSVCFNINEIPFESGVQYVFHNLQPQKIQIESQIDNAIANQNSLIKANEVAVFATSKPKLSNYFNAELGLRINYYSSGSNSNSYLHLQPRIILSYLPNKNLSFYSSYNRQNQYLSLITTSSVGIPTDFWIASSDGIKPQSSDEFSIGSNQTISKNYSSSFGGFYRSMKNLLEYPYNVTQFNEISAFNRDLLAGKGAAYGLEMMLRKDNRKFKGWLSYTLSWSNRNFEEINNGNTYFAKYDRRHNLSLVGMYDLNLKWNFSITQIFSSGNRFTMPSSWYFINNNPVKEYSEYNNSQMPNYIRTDLSATYFFYKTTKKESALNFSIYNTFNIENPIYIVMNVKVNDDKKSVVVETEKKYLYKIIPSISWKFKF